MIRIFFLQKFNFKGSFDNSPNVASARTQFWTPLETPNSIDPAAAAILSHCADNNELELLLDNQKK